MSLGTVTAEGGKGPAETLPEAAPEFFWKVPRGFTGSPAVLEPGAADLHIP
jgi:hypothetical protein